MEFAVENPTLSAILVTILLAVSHLNNQKNITDFSTS